MTKPLKIWLWIVLVLNVLSACLAAAGAMTTPILWASVVLEAILILGVALLLFRQRKMGFYIICAVAVATLIVNIAQGTNVGTSVLSSFLMPLIIYLLMRSTWNEFH